jgi:hypothetical protein
LWTSTEPSVSKGMMSALNARGDMVLARVFAPYPDPAAFLKTALGGGFGRDSLAKLTDLNRGLLPRASQSSS